MFFIEWDFDSLNNKYNVINMSIIISNPYNNKNISYLRSNLAGLIEGDGTIITPKKPKSPSGSINVGFIEIIFSIKDISLGLNLQNLLGGRIYFRANSCILRIKRKENLYLLILLINGYMRTPKIQSLHNLIEWYNYKYNVHIPLLGLDYSPLISNSWLSGFFDADGSFYLNWSKNDKNTIINLQ